LSENADDADECAVPELCAVRVARLLVALGGTSRRNAHHAMSEGRRVTHYTRESVVPSIAAEHTARAGHRSIVLTLLTTVVLLDQATKWWAWRHMSGALINPGGDLLVGPSVGSWYADVETGRFLDLLSVGFLSIAVLLLVRRRRTPTVLASAALMIGGWGSNLLDRLGMHSWTAPGSIRGAVDFVPVSHFRFNLADIVIIGATAVFVLALGRGRLTSGRRSVLAHHPARPARRRRRAWRSAFAGAAGFGLVVAVGTIGYTAAVPATAHPIERTVSRQR
jgi:lipoprotein signal peptidase